MRILSIDTELLDAAADLPPSVLSSLDAVHLAAARTFGEELEAIVTYDRRMRDAAAAVGLPSAMPK